MSWSRKRPRCWASRWRRTISANVIARARLFREPTPSCLHGCSASTGSSCWTRPMRNCIASPLFVESIERAAELDVALLARNREISQAHYHEQVKVTEESTPLFALVDGARVPIHRSNGEFAIRKERLSLEELKRRIAAAPEDFN